MKGLYVHIPFCRRKCFYCDFVSVGYDENFVNKYLTALEKEAEKYKTEKLKTIYIGGGTPSVLSVYQLDTLISIIKNNFDVSNICEWSFEANPESITKEKLCLLLQSGITRLSFGLQSVFDDRLRILGRLHNYEDFKKVYFLARETGFDNINIDLMFGVPEQTIDEWGKTIKEVLYLNPQHISLYPLTIEEGTVFYKNNVFVDTDMQAQMYKNTCEILKENNFEHYEISNWAREQKYSHHNKLYWQNKEYIGLGAAASSYYKRYRYKNETNILKYIDETLRGND
ncbi:MAG: radical SAM family heme chaperone HemW, partial [Elusimicrobia bacterium]|nr:radical SAM family heme chaperone HemW [Elusimicrobiota bacterium]